MPARPESVRPSQERSDRRPAFDKETGRRIGTWYSGKALDDKFREVEERQRNAVSGDLFDAKALMSTIPASRGKGRHQGDW